MKKEIFVPPGVQMRLSARLGTIPRQGTPAIAAKIEKLWQERNSAPEDQLDRIDGQMESIVVAGYIAERARLPRVIYEQHNLHGTGSRRHKVFVMPVKNTKKNSLIYWPSVTDVRCPCCERGMIQWHEAGYVPGYRICDGCKRTFLASGNAALPKLILDI